MSALPVPFVTPEEYLEIERKAEFKSEYLSGQMFAMAGGSPAHSTLGTNIARMLGNFVRHGPCQVFNSDLRVTIMQTGLKTYPDVTVVCGDPYFHPLDTDSLINPTVLIEVLSDSTESYDRGEKWANYQQSDSLQEYILVSQHSPRIEKYLRQSSGNWLYSQGNGLEGAITLDSLGCSLALADVYERVTFPRTEPGGEEAGTMGSGEHTL